MTRPATLLLALAIFTIASPFAHAGPVTVTSSRIFYEHLAGDSWGGTKFQKKENLSFPTFSYPSELIVISDFGQASSRLNASVALRGGTPQSLTAQINGEVIGRSRANTDSGGVSVWSQAHLFAFYDIAFDVTQPIFADLEVIGNVRGRNSLQAGAEEIDPWTRLDGGLWDQSTNEFLSFFTTNDNKLTGDWHGQLDPGHYRLFGTLGLTRNVSGGTIGDPSFSSFVLADGAVLSTLRFTAVPEPATIFLFAIAAALLGACRATRRRT